MVVHYYLHQFVILVAQKNSPAPAETELYKSPFFFHLGSSVTLCNKKWHPGTLSTASFSRAKVMLGKRTAALRMIMACEGITSSSGHKLPYNFFVLQANRADGQWLSVTYTPAVFTKVCRPRIDWKEFLILFWVQEPFCIFPKGFKTW